MTAAITDFTHFASLRSGADQKDPAVLREVAGQFEALFIQSILKNMRAGELAEPLFGDSDQHEMYQGMMDQQLALEMASGRGIGLAEMLVRQLGGEGATVQPTAESISLPAQSGSTGRNNGPEWENPEAFARDLWPHVQRVAKKLNIAPEALLAQAALETGWGEHVIKRSNGISSFNVFGIKATRDWPGGSVARPTLEYTDGVAQRSVERFKAYDNISATFDDYVALISDNPRYETVRNHGSDAKGFASALQDAGYATDPSYARKIGRVLGSATMQGAIRSLKNALVAPTLRHRAAAVTQ